MLVQIFFPTTVLPLWANVDGVNLSTWQKAPATISLNRAYEDSKIGIFFSDNEKPYQEVTPADIGLKVENRRRIEAAGYPWYIRIVPTSLLWWGLVMPTQPPTLNYDDVTLRDYIKKTFGRECEVAPRNASLEINGDSIHLTKASVGGKCNSDDLKQALKSIDFVSVERGEVRLDIVEKQPDVSNQDALDLGDKIAKKMLNDLELEFDGYNDRVRLRHEELVSWVKFEVIDGKLTVVLDEVKSAEFYKSRVAPLVESAAGVTTITTSDLTKVIRKDGTDGKMVNIKETNQRIAEYLMDERQSVIVAIEAVEPEVKYASSFTSTSAGISALIKRFAQTHDGVFGVKLVEIGGGRRQGDYQAGKEFEVVSQVFRDGLAELEVDEDEVRQLLTAGNWVDWLVGVKKSSRDAKTVEKIVAKLSAEKDNDKASFSILKTENSECVLGIFSTGSSWSEIEDLIKQISELLKR